MFTAPPYRQCATCVSCCLDTKPYVSQFMRMPVAALHLANVHTSLQILAAMNRITTNTKHRRTTPDAYRSKFLTPKYKLTGHCFHWNPLPSLLLMTKKGRPKNMFVLCAMSGLPFDKTALSNTNVAITPTLLDSRWCNSCACALHTIPPDTSLRDRTRNVSKSGCNRPQ